MIYTDTNLNLKDTLSTNWESTCSEVYSARDNYVAFSRARTAEHVMVKL